MNLYNVYSLELTSLTIPSNRSRWALLLATFFELARLNRISKGDPGFLERGCLCIKVRGFALLILSHFSYISFESEIIWSQ